MEKQNKKRANCSTSDHEQTTSLGHKQGILIASKPLSINAQQSLNSFFKNKARVEPIEGTPVVIRGSSSMEDFADAKADVWCWNVNGVNSVIEKGVLQQFIAKNDPTVLCLNETKTDIDKIDKKMLYDKIGQGYG